MRVFIPDAPLRWGADAPARPLPKLRRRLALFYLLGAAGCLGAAAALGGWAWLGFWPGVALGLLSLAYFGLGVSVFQKHDGQLSWAARVLLAPFRLGAWWVSRWFTRRGAPAVPVGHGIWLGRAPGRRDWPHLPVGAVLDLTAEFNLGRAARARPHRSVPLLDLVVPTAPQLAQAAAALDELTAHPTVLVHCALGYSRGAVVVAAWLLRRGLAATPAAAVAQLRAARPQVLLSTAHLAALAAFQQELLSEQAA